MSLVGQPYLCLHLIQLLQSCSCHLHARRPGSGSQHNARVQARPTGCPQACCRACWRRRQLCLLLQGSAAVLLHLPACQGHESQLSSPAWHPAAQARAPRPAARPGTPARRPPRQPRTYPSDATTPPACHAAAQVTYSLLNHRAAYILNWTRHELSCLSLRKAGQQMQLKTNMS